MPGTKRPARQGPTVGTNFASDPRDLGGKGTQLLDHRIDGFLEWEFRRERQTVIFFERSPFAIAPLCRLPQCCGLDQSDC